MKTPCSLDTEPVSRHRFAPEECFACELVLTRLYALTYCSPVFPNLHRRAHPTGSRTLRRMLASQGFVELEQA